MMKGLIPACLLMLLILPACDSGGPGGGGVDDYESDLGEAVIRHLIKSLPDPAPGVPKVYCVVKGPSLEAVKTDFARRFVDLKLRFVSGNVLMVTEPDNAVVDPDTRLSPFVLQIRAIKPEGSDRFEVEVGWSYKKLYEKERYRVQLKDGAYTVTNSTRIAGNYEPPNKS